MSIIKAGYRITVTSLENDGDAYNTISKDGYTLENARFLVDLISILKGECGNLYEPRVREITNFNSEVQKVIGQHPSVAADYDICNDYENYGESACEVLEEFTGYSDGYFTRQVESIVVEYIPVAIIIQDVTEQFIGD